MFMGGLVEIYDATFAELLPRYMQLLLRPSTFSDVSGAQTALNRG